MHRRQTVALFLCAEGLLYAAFLSIDLLRPTLWLDVPLKYLSIVLCLIFALTGLHRGYSRPVTVALAFTLLADAFLLVLDRYYLLGVLSFCVTQGLYFYRICRAKDSRLSVRIFIRLLVALGALFLLAILGALEPLTAVTALYFTQLAANAVESLTLGRRYVLFAVGLFLFVCCDLCVGLYQLFPLLSIGGPFGGMVVVGMWLFYLPSQVLITLSGQRERM